MSHDPGSSRHPFGTADVGRAGTDRRLYHGVTNCDHHVSLCLITSHGHFVPSNSRPLPHLRPSLIAVDPVLDATLGNIRDSLELARVSPTLGAFSVHLTEQPILLNGLDHALIALHAFVAAFSLRLQLPILSR